MREAAAVDEIQREELSRVFGSFAWLRAATLPIPLSVLIYISLFDPAWWRRGLLLTIAVAMVGFGVGELWLLRRGGIARLRIGRTFFIAGLGTLGMIGATGGIESPFILSVIPIAVLVASLQRDWRLRAAFTATQIAAFWGLTICALLRLAPSFIPAPFGGGPRAGHGDALLCTQAALLSLAAIVASVVGARCQRGLIVLLARTREARQDALEAHAEQARSLTALSGEIAHELKNPLASVKGLAALMATDQQGKNLERVAVLRREIERMQTILEEFLNFSRPLGPFTKEPADLVELCQSTIALHEGLLRDGRISVAVRASGALNVSCDARKIKQVLINVLQNAIAASSPSGEITVEVEADDGCARIRILDRGGGLPASFAPHAFDAGATTKPAGNGLGLTIARALMRQHGGDLTLENRPGGGCVAEIKLPTGET